MLLPLLHRTAHSRVVSLYSLAASWGHVRFDDLQFAKKYEAANAYSQSKLACLMFAIELDKRLRAARYSVSALAAHPGVSESELNRHLPSWVRMMMSIFGSAFMQSAAAGALPTLYAALDEAVHGGEATAPSGRGEMKGPPRVVAINPKAQDAAARERLWSISEQLCGFEYAF